MNPIRLIDTAGFDDAWGEEYDKKITNQILELFTIKIETILEISLNFKFSDIRVHERNKTILDKLFSLFGQIVKKILLLYYFCRWNW